MRANLRFKALQYCLDRAFRALPGLSEKRAVQETAAPKTHLEPWYCLYFGRWRGLLDKPLRYRDARVDPGPRLGQFTHLYGFDALARQHVGDHDHLVTTF